MCDMDKEHDDRSADVGRGSSDVGWSLMVPGAMLRDLAERQEVLDVLTRFCRGVDRLDEQLVRSCFHPGARDDHGMFSGTGDEFAAYVIESGRTMTASQHCTTNLTLRRRDSHLDSEAYVTVVLRMRNAAGGASDHTIHARYVDRFERRGGALLIAERLVVYDMTRIDEVRAGWGLGEGYTEGVRGLADPSYRGITRHGA